VVITGHHPKKRLRLAQADGAGDINLVVRDLVLVAAWRGSLRNRHRSSRRMFLAPARFKRVPIKFSNYRSPARCSIFS
jgi:hypothetical protein